jgi:hypothetical protein
MTKHEFTCIDCKQFIIHESNSTTGYAEMWNKETKEYDKKVCFACCALRDITEMIESGHSKRLPLYLTKGAEGNYFVSNWPGTLRFSVKSRWTGNHNWYHVGKVEYVRFIGPDKKVWSGKCVGDWTQVVHCKRTKLTSCFI